MLREKRKLVFDVAMIFLVAAALRLGLALFLSADDTVFYDRSYLEYAQNFAEGRGFWMTNPYGSELDIPRAYAFRPPLFSFLWGCVYNLTGGAYGPIRVTFALVGAMTCAVACLAGLELTGDRRVAVIGGLLCAVYPPLVWHSVHLMTEPLFIFFGTVSILALLRLRRTRHWKWALAAGVAAGLGALTRSVLAGFLPFIAVWVWWTLGRRRQALLMAVVVCAAAVAVLSPWTIRNAVVFKSFVPSTTDVGHGAYVANNPNALADPRGFWIPDDWSFLKEPDGTSVGEVEASKELTRRAVTYLRQHPGAALRLMARRFIHLWRFYPNPRYLEQPRHALVYALSYMPLFPFVLAGLWLAHRQAGERRANVVLVDLLIFYTTAVHVAVLAMMRYRVPLMPFLLVFAALAMQAGWRRIAKWGRKDRAPAGPSRQGSG